MYRYKAIENKNFNKKINTQKYNNERTVFLYEVYHSLSDVSVAQKQKFLRSYFGHIQGQYSRSGIWI